MTKVLGGQRKCAYPNCGHHGSKGLFSMPKEVKKYTLWVKACNLSEEIDHSKAYICIKHFKDSDISQTEKSFRLHAWAIPISSPTPIVPSTLIKAPRRMNKNPWFGDLDR